MFTSEEEARFRSKFKTNREGCWLWLDALDKDGYGTFYFRRRKHRAHRVAYVQQFGPMPEGMVVDHLCRRRHCVNPDHLRLVSASQNALENSKSVSALNRQKTACPQGHPFDRAYGGQRYCSICEAEKKRRLMQKWKTEPNPLIQP